MGGGSVSHCLLQWWEGVSSGFCLGSNTPTHYCNAYHGKAMPAELAYDSVQTETSWWTMIWDGGVVFPSFAWIKWLIFLLAKFLLHLKYSCHCSCPRSLSLHLPPQVLAVNTITQIMFIPLLEGESYWFWSPRDLFSSTTIEPNFQYMSTLAAVIFIWILSNLL